MAKQSQIVWILKQHEDTNHFYDKYLPYRFHLEMAVQVFKEFKHLLPKNLFVIKDEIHRGIWEDEDVTLSVIELACYGHDLVEDTRVNFNDVKRELSVGNYDPGYAAEIIRAVTNYGRGRNRDERMPDFVYQEIKETPGATFTKLCDRIANVRFSVLTKSSMTKKYKFENPHFKEKLYVPGEFEEMWAELESLFEKCNDGNVQLVTG